MGFHSMSCAYCKSFDRSMSYRCSLVVASIERTYLAMDVESSTGWRPSSPECTDCSRRIDTSDTTRRLLPDQVKWSLLLW